MKYLLVLMAAAFVGAFFGSGGGAWMIDRVKARIEYRKYLRKVKDAG